MICMVQILPLSALGTSFPTAEYIATTFNITDPSILPWTVAAYALTFGTFILIAGRLGDIVGHKHMVVIGFVIMGLSSLLAGLSIYSSYVLYFIARALQGIGSAFMQPNGLALLGGMYPSNSKKKNLAFALFGAMAAPGAYLGMLFGALLAHYPSWAWSSYALSVAAVVCALLAHFVLISPPQAVPRSTNIFNRFATMDWAGSITGVAGLTCIAIAWVQAPSLGWSTQYIYMLLLIGLITLSIFILIELKVATHPLVPFKMLKPSIAFILASIGLGWASFGIYIFYLWQLLLYTRQLTPLHTALRISPVVPVGFLANALTGLLMHRTPASVILLISLLAFTTSAILLALTPQHQSYWSLTFASLTLVPFGMDMSFPAATVTISNSLPPDQQGIAGSLVATVVNYSMSLGLGFASTALRYVNGPDSQSASASTTTPENTTNPSLSSTPTPYRPAFIVSIALGALGTLLCLVFVTRDLLHLRATRRTKQAQQQPRKVQPQHVLSRRQLSRFTMNEDRQMAIGRDQERGMSCETLWEAHPAVRPLGVGGVGLVARD
jgi:MFS family permease